MDIGGFGSGPLTDFMLDWIWPQTVAVKRSVVNGEIRVVKSRGKYAVVVDGFEQSGPALERVWRQGLKKIPAEKVLRVLVLGFGCGSVVGPIRERWPAASIVGVEIDEVMLDLGKKYFPANFAGEVEVAVGDGRKRHGGEFDLVIVDAYVGGKAVLGAEEYLSIGTKMVLVNRLVGGGNEVLLWGS